MDNSVKHLTNYHTLHLNNTKINRLSLIVLPFQIDEFSSK
jgi:hypothetical protein